MMTAEGEAVPVRYEPLPGGKAAVFQTLKAATAAALAYIERVHAGSNSRKSPFSTGPSPEHEAMRRKFLELTEDRVETFYS